MPKVSETYKIYLKPKHLPNGGEVRQATIESARLETLHPRPGVEQQAIVISFVGRPHRLILNQGNANRMIDIAGDDCDQWKGKTIGLKRGKWGGKPTIHIVPVDNSKAEEDIPY